MSRVRFYGSKDLHGLPWQIPPLEFLKVLHLFHSHLFLITQLNCSASGETQNPTERAEWEKQKEKEKQAATPTNAPAAEIVPQPEVEASTEKPKGRPRKEPIDCSNHPNEKNEILSDAAAVVSDIVGVSAVIIIS